MYHSEAMTEIDNIAFHEYVCFDQMVCRCRSEISSHALIEKM